MGPLTGIRIVELGGIGPGPFAAMLFSEMGADVVRITRRQAAEGIKGFDKRYQLLNRGRRTIALDPKNPRAVETVKRMIAKADAVTEGFRPGVAGTSGARPRRLPAAQSEAGLRPHHRLGTDGPLAAEPGHDINYIALDASALHAIGSKHGLDPFPPAQHWSAISAAAR